MTYKVYRVLPNDPHRLLSLNQLAFNGRTGCERSGRTCAYVCECAWRTLLCVFVCGLQLWCFDDRRRNRRCRRRWCGRRRRRDAVIAVIVASTVVVVDTHAEG